MPQEHKALAKNFKRNLEALSCGAITSESAFYNITLHLIASNQQITTDIWRECLTHLSDKLLLEYEQWLTTEETSNNYQKYNHALVANWNREDSMKTAETEITSSFHQLLECVKNDVRDRKIDTAN